MGRRDGIILLAAVLAAVILTFLVFFGGKPLEAGAWGLSFRQEGQPPVAPVNRDTLAKMGGIYLGDPEEKTIYLTFDAGYENGCTEKILDTLQKHSAPGAFFLVGNYLERNADLVRRMVDEGHLVGNHTMHHRDMSQLKDPAVFGKELTDLEDLFRQVTGKELPKIYRPPQGIYSEENLKMAREMGYTTVFWSLAYADWDNANQPTRDQAFQKLIPRIHNGAVVLLHSTSQTNAEILDELLTKWEEMGYTFGSLTDLT